MKYLDLVTIGCSVDTYVKSSNTRATLQCKRRFTDCWMLCSLSSTVFHGMSISNSYISLNLRAPIHVRHSGVCCICAVSFVGVTTSGVFFGFVCFGSFCAFCVDLKWLFCFGRMTWETGHRRPWWTQPLCKLVPPLPPIRHSLHLRFHKCFIPAHSVISTLIMMEYYHLRLKVAKIVAKHICWHLPHSAIRCNRLAFPRVQARECKW